MKEPVADEVRFLVVQETALCSSFDFQQGFGILLEVCLKFSSFFF